MRDAIRIEGLSKQLGASFFLDRVSFVVPEGGVYALVGANGAGKTTLIKLLLNILRPSPGQASVLGVDSTKLSGQHFRRIGYISENQDLPGWMTVAALLDYLRPFYPTWDSSLERQMVDLFKLPLKQNLKHLSRGMRMKAGFACTLPFRPSVMVLDEPFSGLDPLVRDELIEALLDSAQETTILLSSQDIGEMESFASDIGYLEQGRLLFSQEMSTLISRFREVTVTFDYPPTLPGVGPKDWLHVEVTGAVARFVHCAYENGSSEQELRTVFPSTRDVSFEPMSLRSIFLAIAKSEANRSEHDIAGGVGR